MKNLYLIACLLAGHGLYAQSEILNENKVSATVNANGCLFTNPTANIAGYGIPDTNGINSPKTIYNSAFWIGAKDQNGATRVCANMFILNEKDFKTGPVATNYTAQSFINKYDYVYAITSAQIQTHQQNWNSQNYVMPDDIVNWPGNGDAANGEASILAPFVDYNANDLYEPSLGDHPVIRGDKAMYFILNDHDGDHPHSGGMNMDMEYHFMLYQFATAGFLDSTTFINLKIINRSQNTYDELIVGNYIDFNIGGPRDDYAGCSSDKNMVFAYNGDAIDDGQAGGAPMFGDNPPACGVKLLNHEMAVAVVYSIAGGPVLGDPTADSTIWRALNGQWGNGVPFTHGNFGFGGTIPTSFIYDGNPNDTTIWTERTDHNPPEDRRAFLASEPVDGFAPGDYICYDYAVLYSRTGGSAFLNVNGLFNAADDVQAFYDAESFFYCEPLLLGVNDSPGKESDISIYPNPAQHEFRVSADGVFDISVYDMSGKLVFSSLAVTSSDILSTPKEAGIYLVQINGQDYSETQKLVVK